MNHKFNAWDEETKTMYLAGNDHIVLDSDGTCYNLQTGNKLIPLLFTGIKDINNIEIFLGDICSIKELHNNVVVENIYEIKYSCGAFGIDVANWEGLSEFWNIIPLFVAKDIVKDDIKKLGNKFQNLELLNDRN